MTIEIIELPELTTADATRIAGFRSRIVAHSLIRDLAQALAVYNDEDVAGRTQRVAVAVETAKNMAPADALEAQLVVQLVCTHNIAADAMRRAGSPGLSLYEHDMALKQAAKFMNLYQQQVGMLTKYRANSAQARKDREIASCGRAELDRLGAEVMAMTMESRQPREPVQSPELPLVYRESPNGAVEFLSDRTKRRLAARRK